MKYFILIFLTIAQIAVAQTPMETYQAAQKNQLLIVDIREKDEIDQGMVDQAMWVAKSDIDQNGPQWQNFEKKAKTYKKVALYCRSGRRAGLVIEKFKSLGLEVENLGGLKDFESAGVKIIKPN